MGMANGGRIGFRGGGMDMGAGSSKALKVQGQQVVLHQVVIMEVIILNLTQMIIENNMEHRVNTQDLLQHQVMAVIIKLI
jgi:tRNA(Arg) A34 adenosine deaminase TadA